MDPAIGIALVAIAVSIGTYILVRRRGTQIREADKREKRIDQFVNDYVDRARRHVNTGITALIPARIFRLKDDGEIRESLDICAKQLGKHPLGKSKEMLEDVDLKAFFEFVASRGNNFATESVEQVLARFRANGR